MRSILVLFAACSFACGDMIVEPEHLHDGDYPDWVVRGSGAFVDDDGEHIFCGVGSASGIKNSALAKTTAANRARNEIAKMFEVYSASLMKDYMAQMPPSQMTASPEEQHVGHAIKTFTATTLSAVEIDDDDVWMHPDGTAFALATLDLATFVTALDQMLELNTQVRQYVRQNATRVHRELQQIE